MRYYIRVDHNTQKFAIDEVYNDDYSEYEYTANNMDHLVTDVDGDVVYFNTLQAAEKYLLDTYKTEYLPDSVTQKASTRDFIKKATK